jgi:transposase InsO family protein
LARTGVFTSRKRVARLMQQDGLQATPRRRWRVTTQSDPRALVVPNRLERQFAVAAHPDLDRAWVADITYIGTDEGWLYLAVILDLASRRVVGWALGIRLEAELALTALRQALAHRQPRGGIHHSDQGAQYLSTAYGTLLAEAGLTMSLSRRGDCWDNAVAESFFATLTKELLDHIRLRTRLAARIAIGQFIEDWYNRERLHSSLGYHSPVAYELQLLAAR